MNNRNLLFLLLLHCIWLSPLMAQQRAIDQFIQTSGLKTADIAIDLIDTKTGVSVASFNKDKLLTPASILKIITTATALEIYGPNYRIQTALQYSGKIDEKGVLHGDIYVKGAGDPTLSSEFIERDKNDFLKKCTAAIQKAGIKRIEGRIIADESCFDMEGVSPKWLWEDLGNYFAAGSYGISYNDNMYRLYLKSGEKGSKPEIIRTTPEMPQLHFLNFLEAKNNDKDSAYIYGIPFLNERWLFGSIPANKSSFSIKGDIPDPPYYLASCLYNALINLNISISGDPMTYRLLLQNREYPATERNLLYTSYSPPLKDIIRETNVKSNNHYAEHLLKLIALSTYSQASFDKGTETVKTYWKKKGINLSDIFMYDGSGLSPVNKVAPEIMTDILLYMNNQSKYASDFYASLPVAGKEGTVRNLLKNITSDKSVHLKSGSISNVQCYAGYLNKGNKRYVFCFMANNYGIPRKTLVNAVEKMILNW